MFSSLFVAAILVFPAYLISTAIAGSGKRNKAAVEKAIAKGHVVTAVLKRRSAPQIDVPGMTTPGMHCLGVYEYEYKGKRYKYRYWATDPPNTLKLYFNCKPRKARVAGAMVDSNISWPIVYLIVAGILLLFTY